jgi:hypothetical protein
MPIKNSALHCFFKQQEKDDKDVSEITYKVEIPTGAIQRLHKASDLEKRSLETRRKLIEKMEQGGCPEEIRQIVEKTIAELDKNIAVACSEKATAAGDILKWQRSQKG